MSLSPWDLSGNISFDFSLYRPRRASYVFATQVHRRRNESYRHATKSDSNSGGDSGAGVDFIEGIVRKKRKDSYKAATQHEEIELGKSDARENHICTVIPEGTSVHSLDLITASEKYATLPGDRPLAPERNSPGGAGRSSASRTGLFLHDPDLITPDIISSTDYERHKWRYRKNLVVLTLSFILVFTAFRSIQNLQSSINTNGRLGVIAMGCVHGTMFLTCLFAPVLINKFTSKWTIVLGLLFYLFWVVAHFYPHFYTLIPTSIGVGFGQSLAWGAQVTYIQKLAVDYALVSKELTQQEMYKFNGIFLACFQTSHIWGNLVSSLLLGATGEVNAHSPDKCGGYDTCEEKHSMWNMSSAAVASASGPVMKLMGSNLVFAFVGFSLVFFGLEKIGAKSDSEKPCLQMVWTNVQQLSRHKTYRLLIPLLLFNGFEQGFVYADYNKSYITCTIGKRFVGYNMITLGMTNSLFSVLVGIVTRHIPREAIIGMGAILHLALMVFLLVWIPGEALTPVFFVVSALWGICDAIWQTQCNCLVNISCSEDHDVAFQNFRMLQGLGACIAFMLGAVVCVAVKLYILISLLSLAILFYAAVEYRLKREAEPNETEDI